MTQGRGRVGWGVQAGSLSIIVDTGWRAHGGNGFPVVAITNDHKSSDLEPCRLTVRSFRGSEV